MCDTWHDMQSETKCVSSFPLLTKTKTLSPSSQCRQWSNPLVLEKLVIILTLPILLQLELVKFANHVVVGGRKGRGSSYKANTRQCCPTQKSPMGRTF